VELFCTTNSEEANMRHTSPYKILALLLLATACFGQGFIQTPPPYWYVVAPPGALATRPVTCTQNFHVFICNGAGCGTNGEYHYCTAANTWTVGASGAAAGWTYNSGTNTITAVAGATVAIGTIVFNPVTGGSFPNFLGSRTGLELGWVDADTISVSVGGCVTTDSTAISYAGGNITFAALDTGARTIGKDYAAFLTAAGVKLTAISTFHAGGLFPSTYTAANTCLLGYFHNGKGINTELPRAAAPTSALGVGAGSVDNGAHVYSVTFVNAYGETSVGILSAAATVVDNTTNGKVELTNIPLGGVGTTSRKVYGSKAAGTLQYYIGTIPNNSTTVYTVNVADVALTVDAPLVNTTAPTTGAVFQYSVTSNDKLNRTYPFRAVQDLAAGVPLPGMVKVGSVAFGIYEASHEDASPTSAGTSAYVTSRYGVVPWVSVEGWTAMSVLPQSGLRLPTWAEWLAAVTYNPGSVTPASQNGNTNSGASSDAAAQTCAADPTQAGRCLTGTGPRTSSWAGAAAGSSWYSPSGLADAVGNIAEFVAQFFGGLQPLVPGGGIAWGYQGDYAYNFYGQSYNPVTGGYTNGLPSVLVVGGFWYIGSIAGVRYVNAIYSPGDADNILGFRSAR
jgi:hypothetical protein